MKKEREKKQEAEEITFIFWPRINRDHNELPLIICSVETTTWIKH